MHSPLTLDILAQPDDTTCGPTCLQALYAYYDDPISLEQVVAEVKPLEAGGTLAVLLASHALRRGYRATIYTYNLHLYDPTWFEHPEQLPEKLEAQSRAKPDEKLQEATRAYLEFLSLGGRILFEDLTPELLLRHLHRGAPILTGLSSSYLYRSARERDDKPDDVAGTSTGHFVVLCGYDPLESHVRIADPLHDNPGFGAPLYDVEIPRLIGAIYLGIVTYDANLLVLEPGDAEGFEHP